MKNENDSSLLSTKERWQRFNESQPKTIFTPEQIVEYLEQYRQFMFEYWKSNPEAYEIWKRKRDESK